MTKCPKCGSQSGDDWSRCKGSCPMPGSPHYSGAPRTVATNTDHDALLAIQDLLDGVEWSNQTLDDVAQVMIKAGYKIRDRDEVLIEELSR